MQITVAIDNAVDTECDWSAGWRTPCTYIYPTTFAKPSAVVAQLMEFIFLMVRACTIRRLVPSSNLVVAVHSLRQRAIAGATLSY